LDAVIGDFGEKRLLKEVILPLVNPNLDPYLAGDDCGIVDVPDGHYLCASTDRVPWDLTAYRLKIISERELGYYLAVLNLSDIAATGASPVGLLLNFALPPSFSVRQLVDIMSGVLAASTKYGVSVLGGDLSDAAEPSLSATSIGIGRRGMHLGRAGAQEGDFIYISGLCGLAATAFRYFLEAKPRGLSLATERENLLKLAFTNPVPQIGLGQAIAASGNRATAMDNTDGLSQSLSELADASFKHYVIHQDLLPIHPVTAEVAEYLSEDPFELALGPGADFNLVGTIDSEAPLERLTLNRIGQVEAGSGISILTNGVTRSIQPRGWNYFRERNDQ